MGNLLYGESTPSEHKTPKAAKQAKLDEETKEASAKSLLPLQNLINYEDFGKYQQGIDVDCLLLLWTQYTSSPNALLTYSLVSKFWAFSVNKAFGDKLVQLIKEGKELPGVSMKVTFFYYFPVPTARILRRLPCESCSYFMASRAHGSDTLTYLLCKEVPGIVVQVEVRPCLDGGQCGRKHPCVDSVFWNNKEWELSEYDVPDDECNSGGPRSGIDCRFGKGFINSPFYLGFQGAPQVDSDYSHFRRSFQFDLGSITKNQMESAAQKVQQSHYAVQKILKHYESTTPRYAIHTLAESAHNLGPHAEKPANGMPILVPSTEPPPLGLGYSPKYLLVSTDYLEPFVVHRKLMWGMQFYAIPLGKTQDNYYYSRHLDNLIRVVDREYINSFE